MKFVSTISLLFFLTWIFPNECTAQNKEEFLKYLKGVEKRLDSLRANIATYESETRDKIKLLESQNNQLSENTLILERKRAEIDKLNADIAEKTEFIDSQSLFLTVFMGISAVALFSIVALITTIREKKSINKMLQDKNAIIKQQVTELKQKNNEITDSIRYAKKIQDTILPTPLEIKEALPDSFIYYRPKDIISGDFYWLTEADQKIYFATADCTGHGVPGALMSMLGISYLNEIINEKKLRSTSAIMNELRRSITTSLSKNEHGEGMKDGMDMVLYCLDKKNMKLTYSTANNGILVIRDQSILKLEIDKIPVGASPRSEESFNQYEFDLKTGDFIITYSDGFADQFGGPKGKKYKYKQLQELLIQLQQKPISTVPSILNIVFEKWKGSLEQVDDVLVVGIKI